MKKKRREFWIKQCDYIPDRAVSNEESAKCTSGCNHKPIHVKEILDTDCQKCHLDEYCSCDKDEEFDLITYKTAYNKGYITDED